MSFDTRIFWRENDEYNWELRAGALSVEILFRYDGKFVVAPVYENGKPIPLDNQKPIYYQRIKDAFIGAKERLKRELTRLLDGVEEITPVLEDTLPNCVIAGCSEGGIYQIKTNTGKTGFLCEKHYQAKKRRVCGYIKVNPDICGVIECSNQAHFLVDLDFLAEVYLCKPHAFPGGKFMVLSGEGVLRKTLLICQEEKCNCFAEGYLREEEGLLYLCEKHMNKYPAAIPFGGKGKARIPENPFLMPQPVENAHEHQSYQVISQPMNPLDSYRKVFGMDLTQDKEEWAKQTVTRLKRMFMEGNPIEELEQ